MNEREVELWELRGVQDARQECKTFDSPDANESNSLRDYWAVCFDNEHPELSALLAQRQRCVEARLNGYYTEWTAINGEQRVTHEAERIASLNGPVRTRKVAS